MQGSDKTCNGDVQLTGQLLFYLAMRNTFVCCTLQTLAPGPFNGEVDRY